MTIFCKMQILINGLLLIRWGTQIFLYPKIIITAIVKIHSKKESSSMESPNSRI